MSLILPPSRGPDKGRTEEQADEGRGGSEEGSKEEDRLKAHHDIEIEAQNEKN